MIEIKHNRLKISFPEVHESAVLEIDFQRTLRIPDDGREHFLPPGLGSFPIRHVDDYPETMTEKMKKFGGVVLPMYQAEAMWLNFSSPKDYPFALKIAAGKINAVNGETWEDGLKKKPQNYVAVPDQPWLDGFCISKGVIRQFIAMPLGKGYSAEEQINGKSEFGGLQLEAVPLHPDYYKPCRPQEDFSGALYCLRESVESYEMGLAPGGKMRQQIYKDHYKRKMYHLEAKSRCFVHILNSVTWHSMTGDMPPQIPPTAQDYTEAGLPWFNYYSDQPTIQGSPGLESLKSAQKLSAGKGGGHVPLDNLDDLPEKIISIHEVNTHRVREADF